MGAALRAILAITASTNLAAAAETEHWTTRYETPIASTLERLFTGRKQAPKDNFCVFTFERKYLQCIAPDYMDEILCEAVSADSNPRLKRLLNEKKVKILADLGYTAPNSDSPNYHRFIEIDSPDRYRQTARWMLETMRRVYNYRGRSELEITCYWPPLVS